MEAEVVAAAAQTQILHEEIGREDRRRGRIGRRIRDRICRGLPRSLLLLSLSFNVVLFTSDIMCTKVRCVPAERVHINEKENIVESN